MTSCRHVFTSLVYSSDIAAWRSSFESVRFGCKTSIKDAPLYLAQWQSRSFVPCVSLLPSRKWTLWTKPEIWIKSPWQLVEKSFYYLRSFYYFHLLPFYYLQHQWMGPFTLILFCKQRHIPFNRISDQANSVSASYCSTGFSGVNRLPPSMQLPFPLDSVFKSPISLLVDPVFTSCIIVQSCQR